MVNNVLHDTKSNEKPCVYLVIYCDIYLEVEIRVHYGYHSWLDFPSYGEIITFVFVVNFLKEYGEFNSFKRYGFNASLLNVAFSY